MLIRGFQKVSLLDFPGKVSAIVFTFGCNFRCPFCHNRDLVLNPVRPPTVPEADIFFYLERRKKLLDGVVVTGGEPTLQSDLNRFLSRCKRLGFGTKLDTNGSRPAALRRLIESGLLDYVAVDVKAPLDGRYREAAGGWGRISALIRVIELLLASSVEFELRTTVVPVLHRPPDLVDLARQISAAAPRSAVLKWYLQQFNPKNCLNPEFEEVRPYGRAELEEILAAVREYVPETRLRGAPAGGT